MKLSTPLRLAILLPLGLIILGGGGFLLYSAISSQQQKNEEVLQKFGFTISPSSPYSETTGVLGGTQLPPSIGDKLTPLEKVIQGLIRTRDGLLEENDALQQQIDALQTRIAELEQYKTLNEQYAPDNFEQELEKIRTALAGALTALPETRHFSPQQLELMADAGVREYARFVEQNPLLLSEAERDRLIKEDLTTYSFCLGNAVELASNSIDEAQLIAAWLATPEQVRLPAQLRADLDVVIPPCRQNLHARLRNRLQTRAAG